MPLFIRRIIFIVFVLGFFTSAVFVLLYANGYRYDVRNHFLEKTGQLTVETKPKGARLMLDGKIVDAPWSHDELTTPATVQYLLSGEYLLAVQKQGFHDWKQRIIVDQGKTTIRNDIVLFSDAGASLVSPISSLSAAYMVPGGVMFYAGNTVFLFDERTSAVSALDTAPEQIASLSVSPSGKRFVVVGKKTWYLFDGTQKTFSAPKKELSFRWDMQGDDLYAFDDHAIYHFDTQSMALLPVISKSLSGDVFIDNDIFVLQKNPQISLKRYAKTTGALLQTINDIPAFFSFVRSANGMILLANGNNALYLFDPKNNRPVFQQVADSNDIAFSDAQHFFSYNDFEIWSHVNTSDHYDRTLVTRQSQAITHVLPLQALPYLIFVSNNKEIHIRDNHSSELTYDVILGTFDSISNVFLNKNETTLYVFGSYQGKNGLFTLPFIEENAVFPLVK